MDVDTDRVIGHPVKRHWYASRDLAPGPATVRDTTVQDVIAQVFTDDELTDLGGGNGLNLLSPRSRQVLRVHKPYVSRCRLIGERRLRGWLADQGLLVARPVDQPMLRCGPRWAEVEEFVPTTGESLTSPTLFAAIGALHRSLKRYSCELPRPMDATFASPGTLLRWHQTNLRDGYSEADGELTGLLRRLNRQWVPVTSLPRQLIHGDTHRDNIRMAADGRPVYFDFGAATTGPRVFDLSYALAHLVTTGGYDLDRSTGLVEAYQDAAHSPLSPAETGALFPFAAAVALYYEVCGWMPGQPWRQSADRLLTEHYRR
ncbi:MAG: phosphotransferase enzyme family protein [Nakamurella sp.]